MSKMWVGREVLPWETDSPADHPLDQPRPKKKKKKEIPLELAKKPKIPLVPKGSQHTVFDGTFHWSRTAPHWRV